jgi:hypothetical protein
MHLSRNPVAGGPHRPESFPPHVAPAPASARARRLSGTRRLGSESTSSRIRRFGAPCEGADRSSGHNPAKAAYASRSAGMRPRGRPTEPRTGRRRSLRHTAHTDNLRTCAHEARTGAVALCTGRHQHHSRPAQGLASRLAPALPDVGHGSCRGTSDRKPVLPSAPRRRAATAEITRAPPEHRRAPIDARRPPFSASRIVGPDTGAKPTPKLADPRPGPLR